MLNTFIITSTINTGYSVISPIERFIQTIKTIESIRQQTNSSKIILIDNSMYIDKEIIEKIKSMVDYFYFIGDRSINRAFQGIKGAGDLYTTLVGFDAIKANELYPKRIFKICGRYCLSQNFDIGHYDQNKFYSKLCFKKRDLSSITNQMFFHTRFWSTCGSIIEDTRDLIKKSFQTHLQEKITIEESFYKNMNFDQLVELEKIHCEGYLAQTNEYIYD